MKISTRGRYALRVMIELAQVDENEFVPMRNVAENQQISLKYLEQILPILKKHGLVLGSVGKGGGYRLAKSPEVCTVREILEATEGSLSPVTCLQTETNSCPRAGLCKTLPIWQNFYRLMQDYFEGITLSDLVKEEVGRVENDGGK